MNTSTFWGFDLREESSFVSHGTPAKPIIFTDVQWVQEQYADPCYSLFVPDFEGATNDIAPVMDFRFCNFYPAANWYEVWAGQDQNGDYMASYDSAVNWTMRDCNLHCGWISLGEPDDGSFHGISYTTFYGVGSVTWDNNLFENELINLQPSYYWYDGTINVDMAFSARNNLFRGGYCVVASQTSSAGNWIFEDNLFDKVNFYQDATLPLDYDYNGYWPLTAAELDSGYTNQFQATTTGDSFTDGGHEVVLSSAPPYVAGTFGNYYLSSVTALYEAGSQTAGAAGLAQYTVLANQFKDVASSPVSIGLHYVAATNNVPVDSDGDGISDYVEDANGNGAVDAGETDPNNSMSNGVTNDIYNVVYDNVDLSGDGLVGRVKKALGMNPLDPGNPLALTQVITGDEPDIATFELPISYSILTNIGGLNLNFNGIDVTLEDFTNAGDGNSLLEWNTTYEPPGQHYLQAQLTLSDYGDDLAILSGVGTIRPFYSSNVMQFFESDSMFDDSGAYIDAQLPEPDADYTIQLYDTSTTPAALVKTITGSTTNGMIQEDWDLTEDDGVTVFTNDTFNAIFHVNLLDPGSGTNAKAFHKLTTNEQGNGFDFMYVYVPTNSALASAFNTDGQIWNGMQVVVDTLLTPATTGGGNADHYDSSFNNYTGEGNNTHGNGLSQGWPGYVNSSSTLTNSSSPTGLLASMKDGTTKNFYCYAHGSGTGIGNYSHSVVLYSWEVADLLGNHYHSKGGLWTKNPYRFVFLDGCSTASQKNWRRAFGIFPLDAPNQAARNKVGPQAYVGWAAKHWGWLDFQNDSGAALNIATAYTTTLDEFYENWMRQVPLAECVQAASTPSRNMAAFPVPQNKKITISGTDSFGNGYSYTYTNVMTSPIYVVGHSGLTRGSIDMQFDKQFAAPVNIE